MTDEQKEFLEKLKNDATSRKGMRVEIGYWPNSRTLMSACLVDPEGLKQGPYRAWWMNGSPHCAGVYKDNLPDGLWKAWWDNGNVRAEAGWKNGYRHGPDREYFMSGKILHEGEFSYGRKGPWKEYDESGNLVRACDNSEMVQTMHGGMRL